jgi:hypothetical protein
MGFKVGRVFELTFEGTDLDGAEIKIRSASIQINLELGECTVERECEIIAEHLVSWNLEDSDGTPITIDAAGILGLEVPVKNLLLKEWLKATRGISAPLDRRSNDTVSSPEEPITMDTL